MAAYDFSSYTTLELTTDLAAAKARLSQLIISGAVVSGSSAGQSFQMVQGQIKDLREYIAALSAYLGHGGDGFSQTRPNFNASWR